MAFDVGFGVFAALLLVLVVFVIRFSRQLARQRGPDGMTLREWAYARAQEKARQRAEQAQRSGRGS